MLVSLEVTELARQSKYCPFQFAKHMDERISMSIAIIVNLGVVLSRFLDFIGIRTLLDI